MPVINLLNQTATTKSVDQNSANIINMYLVDGQDQDKYPLVAYPTPGATLFSAGSSVMRALFTEHGITYGVDGSTFFSVNSSGTRSTLGTLNTSSGWCKIRGNASQLLIVDDSNGYYYDIATLTFHTIVTHTYVSSVVMTSAGTGYDGTTTATINDASGTGATVTVTVVGGQVASVSVDTGGTGYVAPTITFSGPGTGATATVNISTTVFPTSIQDIECQDEFGLVLEKNSQVWHASAISDLSSWPALSFASTTGNQNYNQAILSNHRELYLLGTNTTEIWDNVGTANFTFGRNSSAYIEWGCSARGSVAKLDSTYFYLGQSSTGANIVLRSNAYNAPERISNRAVDYQISLLTTVSDAVGITYQQEGHEFYVLTFPTAGVTFAYDATTHLWHQRQSLVNGSQTKWLASCYTYNYNKGLIGDFNTGNIYYLDMSNNTENNSAITRTLVTHPFYISGMWQFVDKLQIDFDNGPTTNLSNWTLYVSKDGGRTFGTGIPAVPQVDANGMYRVYWTRRGMSRDFVFKLQTDYNMQTIILGAWATVRGGTGV